MENNVVKLGLMPPLTGLVGMYGAEITHAGQIACAEVNEDGGVLGRPLELVIEDDGSLPESAVAAAFKLVDHHRCTAIIGNLLSNSRIAVAYEVAEPRRIPYLNFSFYEGSILSHYFFHFAALPNQQIDLMIPYMRNCFGPRMFFAGNNYEWPRGSIDAAKHALEKAGGQIIGEEYRPIGISESDIESLLDQVAESGADVFVPYFAGADQIRLLSRFTERGLKKRMAVVMGHYDEVMASNLPPAVREGFYSSNTYFMTLDTPGNRSYLSRLARQQGVNGIWPQGNGILTNFGEGAYLCVKAFAKAANQAGSINTEALVSALKTTEVSGPQGEVRMEPTTHHAQVNTFLSRCETDGSFTIIERFGAIPPIIPARYQHLRIVKQPMEEDIYLQSRMLSQMTESVLLARAADGIIVYANPGVQSMFGFEMNELVGQPVTMLFAPSNKQPDETIAFIGAIVSRKGIWQGETRLLACDGRHFLGDTSISIFTHPKHGEVWMMLTKDITERKKAEEMLHGIEWMLTERPAAALTNEGQPYGDLTRLNTSRLILDSVGHETIVNIIGSLAYLLETSLAIYEKNGDYALGIFASGWCRIMDKVSRQLCGTPDNREALRSGRWLCHESCWSEASRKSIETGQAVDIECAGGIRLFALPIRAGNEIIGSINVGYGSPPKDPARLQELAHKYGASPMELHRAAEAYQPRPPFIIEVAKKRVRDAAQLLGEIVYRKQTEEKIRQLNSELEQRVMERTAQLEAANHELEAFAYSVSHDLRVPLRAVDGFSQMLLRDYENKLDDEGKRKLKVVRDNAKRMGQLIDDILAFSRAGRLDMQMTEINMEKLVRKAWEDLAPQLENRKIHINIGPLPGVHGDHTMLHQVWVNLLGNAVKFTAPKGVAHIEAGSTVQDNECIFYVKDNGVGFDSQYAGKLFGVFQRLHSIEEFEGTGIGLAIVKRIITRHGGRVWAEGKVGEGAAFYFVLPEKLP